jgi:hypothetical protein
MRPYQLLVFALVALAGCQHLRGPGLEGPLPAGAPDAESVLSDLAGPDRAVQNFSAGGTITMKIPGQPGRQRFNQSRVHFIHPARVYAKAFKLGQTVHIYVESDTFLLDVPSESTFYFGRAGDQFPDVRVDLAPSLVFRELFLADSLAGVEPSRAVMAHFDPETGQGQLGIYRDDRGRVLERLITVFQGASGWEATESESYDAGGALLARTVFEDYEVIDGVRMPGKTTARLPGGDGELSFQIQSNPRVNRKDPIPIPAIAEVRADLLSRGYQEKTGVSPADAIP